VNRQNTLQMATGDLGPNLVK